MLIKLWTIRHRSEFNKFLDDGVLKADIDWIDPYYIPAYQWMAAQLAKKVAPPRNCTYPLWAWKQWKGVNRSKPDLRASSHLAKGTPGVRIEFSIPLTEVLLSDFDAWHSVLNNHFYSHDDKSYDKYCRIIRDKSNSEIDGIIKQSWNNIFDLNLSGNTDNLFIQANFWELKCNQIVDAKYFIAR